MPDQDLTSLVDGAACRNDRIDRIADWVLARFDDFYREFLDVPHAAKAAFESMHHGTSIWLSRHRLSLYSSNIHRMGEQLKAAQPDVSNDVDFLNRLEQVFWQKVESRYEADVAYAFVHSLRRIVYRDEWRPVEYSFWPKVENAEQLPSGLLRYWEIDGELDAKLFEQVLTLPKFASPYRDLGGDAELIKARVDRLAKRRGAHPVRVEMVDAGFFRNRGAYLVGRIRLANGAHTTCIIALLNSDAGIYCDAVIMDQHLVHNLFSSTLANFHVTTRYYHELCRFLHPLMPHRPLGLHYSTIGYNHVGKVAVMNELKQELADPAGCSTSRLASPARSPSASPVRNRPTTSR